MSKQKSTMLIFVYNADSGVFNGFADLAHKLFSPDTYQCNLCAITYSTFTMRKEWKTYLANLSYPLEFLHRDEFVEKYQYPGLKFPAMLIKKDDTISILLDSEQINTCSSVDDLKQVIQKSLNEL